jgi:serine/threonine-protein kinase
VALKVLHPHLAEEPNTRERFVREGRTLARIHHPSIVQVFDAGITEGAVYLAMELVEGHSLAELLRSGGSLPTGQVVRIVEQVGAALAALHAGGLIHGDVKPANILLEEASGRVVLLDLGVARRLDETLSTHGSLWGTPAFMAPEQVTPGGAISTRTDVYQLGATVHALLAGTPPFTGEPTQVMYAVVHEAPPDLATLHPNITPAVAALIVQTLAKDPQQRPDDPCTFADQLRDRVRPASNSSASDGPTQRLGVHPVTPAMIPAWGAWQGANRIEPLATTVGLEHEPAAAGRERGRRSSSRVALALGGALAALVLAGAAALAFNGRLGDAGDGESSASTPNGGVALQVSQTPTAEASPAPTTTPIASPVASVTPAPTLSPTPQPAEARTPSPQPAIPAATPPPPATTAPPAPATDGIAGLLQQTMARRGYGPSGPVEPVSLGDSGVLYVQRGDGSDGQRLFIVVNDTFLGTDWVDASPMGVSNPRASGPGQFVATYTDASGGAMPVVFSWSGGRLRPDRIAPGHCQPNTGC